MDKVHIIKTDDNAYLVNRKPVIIDSDGRVISKTFELTKIEEQALHDFLTQDLIENYNSGK